MKHSFPRSIVVGPGQRMPVVRKRLAGRLGYFDSRTGEIAIDSDIGEVHQHLILLHEMIHLAADKMVRAGYMKRPPGEAFVTGLAGTLFPMLALSGLWKGPDRRALHREFEPAPRERKTTR